MYVFVNSLNFGIENIDISFFETRNVSIKRVILKLSVVTLYYRRIYLYKLIVINTMPIVSAVQ